MIRRIRKLRDFSFPSRHFLFVVFLYLPLILVAALSSVEPAFYGILLTTGVITTIAVVGLGYAWRETFRVTRLLATTFTTAKQRQLTKELRDMFCSRWQVPISLALGLAVWLVFVVAGTQYQPLHQGLFLLATLPTCLALFAGVSPALALLQWVARLPASGRLLLSPIPVHTLALNEVARSFGTFALVFSAGTASANLAMLTLPLWSDREPIGHLFTLVGLPTLLMAVLLLAIPQIALAAIVRHDRRAKLLYLAKRLNRLPAMEAMLSKDTADEYTRLSAFQAELRSSSILPLDLSTSLKYIAAIGYPLGSLALDHPELVPFLQ